MLDDPAVAPYVRRAADAAGLARDYSWAPGEPSTPPFVIRPDAAPLEHSGGELGEDELTRLFEARGEELQRVFAAADRLRREVCGDDVTYVVTRNIQYTNVCYFRCGFCASRRGSWHGTCAARRISSRERRSSGVRARRGRGRDRGLPAGRDPPGVHGRLLRRRRACDQERGSGNPRRRVLGARAGAATLELGLEEYLAHLRDLGLGSLPNRCRGARRRSAPGSSARQGHAAQWLRVHDAAHRVGLRST